MMNVPTSEYEDLGRTALEARKSAYTPYSHFQVGAALLTEDGTIFTGGNIENAAYTPTNCAERTAFFKAVSEGKRCFTALAVAGGPEGELPTKFCSPCGVCRQVMMEFCDPKTFQIVLVKGNGAKDDDFKFYTLEELLPEGFGPAILKRT